MSIGTYLENLLDWLLAPISPIPQGYFIRLCGVARGLRFACYTSLTISAFFFGRDYLNTNPQWWDFHPAELCCLLAAAMPAFILPWLDGILLVGSDGRSFALRYFRDFNSPLYTLSKGTGHDGAGGGISWPPGQVERSFRPFVSGCTPTILRFSLLGLAAGMFIFGGAASRLLEGHYHLGLWFVSQASAAVGLGVVPGLMVFYFLEFRTRPVAWLSPNEFICVPGPIRGATSAAIMQLGVDSGNSLEVVAGKGDKRMWLFLVMRDARVRTCLGSLGAPGPAGKLLSQLLVA